MNAKEKFEKFLDSLKKNGNDGLIESVKKGFDAYMESFQNTSSPSESSAEEMKSEMKQYLKNRFSGLLDIRTKDFEFDVESAIYWFANHYHEGQWSDLYSILSTSDYRPGRDHSGPENDGEVTKMLYDALVDKYGKMSASEKK